MKFCVAKINFFDSELTQEIKHYPSLVNAYEEEFLDDINDMPDYLALLKNTSNTSDVYIDKIKQEYFNAECMIDIVQIS